MILSAILMALPSTLMAQQNIQKAFDALLNDKIVEIKTQHILESDPQTGRKSAQADVYDFEVVNSIAQNRIKDIRKAFDMDRSAAYSLNSGSHSQTTTSSDDEGWAGFIEAVRSMVPIMIAVGDGGSQAVSIGTMKGSSHIYACFADKDDPDNKYRYCYAMEWAERSNKTQVRLAVTYALRPETREKKRKTNISTISINGDDVKIDNVTKFMENAFNSSLVYHVDSAGVSYGRSSGSWLSEFNNYKMLFLKNPDSSTATHYATSIYTLCKKAGMLEPEEKQIVVSELAKLKAAAKDELIQNIFEMSIKKLKE